MSLVGNLEDLGLGDIAQIVSLSRKSGVLLLERGSSKAKIIFRDGLVLSAFTNTDRQDPARRLVEQGVIEERVATDARARHRAAGGAGSIQACLLAAGVSPEAVENAVRGEIERVVLDLFGWEDGDFNFDLKEVDEDLAKIRAHPHRVLVETGLNPQFLVMEASRIVDEARRSSSGDHPSGGAPKARPTAPAAKSAVPAPERATLPPPVAARSRAEAPTAKPAPRPSSALKIIVVDDDDRFLRLIAPALEAGGYAVECFPGGGPAAERIEVLAPAGEPVVIVSDLLMPRVDGGGLLGGIELLERVRRRFASLPFVLLADHLQEEVEARARLLDVDFTLAKPKSVALGEGAAGAAWREFLGVLKPILESFHRPHTPVQSPEVPREARADSKNARAAGPHAVPREARADSKNARAAGPHAVPREARADSKDARADAVHPRAGRRDAVPSAAGRGPGEATAEGTIDLRRALGGNEDPDLFADSERPPERMTTPGLAILKSMLCELSNPETGAEITLLVLRFAAEIMNRAVLFMVRGREALGLGGFGFDPDLLREDVATARRSPLARGVALRRIRIPLDVPSVLHDVVEKCSVVRGPLESSGGNDRLRLLLGGGDPAEAFVAPIAVADEVVALLYGDNLPEPRPVGETEALEIFLTQAGLALEKAILQRRLSEARQG